MKIKRLDIVGFKSFVDKVTFDFPEGVVGIVGPNGCGKSNIVDAICWAMGEQSAKKLRGKAMEDLIFGGSESRKPHGMAEVSLCFANEDGLAPAAYKDYAEIVVTRRLYRNGDSEYQINKTPCRLLDITELFMDTGVGAKAYSIIEQGKIGMVLNSKPEERRFLIEEAAGVTKFKSRKKSALRKIDATRHNLERLNDIISEVRRQTGSLKRQAKKAESFRELRDEQRYIETRLAFERHQELTAGIQDKGNREKQLQSSIDEKIVFQAEQEASLETTRLDQTIRERSVTEEQERVFRLTTEIQKVEASIEGNSKEEEIILRQQERHTAEEAETVLRLAQLDAEENALVESLSHFRDEIVHEERRLGEAELKLLDITEQELVSSRQLEEERALLYQSLGEMTRFSSQKEDSERRLQSLALQSDKSQSEVLQLSQAHAAAGNQVVELETRLQQVLVERNAMQQNRAELETLRTTLEGRAEANEQQFLSGREELNLLQARLESLRQIEKDLEGYGGGVKTLLSDNRFSQMFQGVVADQLNVPVRYEAAVEAVLGDRLQSLLATERDQPLAAVEFLRQSTGRCTFLLPGFISTESKSLPGTALSGLIGVSAGQTVLNSLLSGVQLVANLQDFFSGNLPPGAILVTESGETLSSRGEFTGGSRDVLQQGLLHKKREIKELDATVAALTISVTRLSSERDELRSELAAVLDGLREVETTLHRNELQTVESERDLAGRRTEVERLQERLEVLSFEADQLHEEKAALTEQLLESSSSHAVHLQKKDGQEQKVLDLQNSVQQLREAREVVSEEVTTFKVAFASCREREESGRQGLEQFGLRRQELQTRVTSLQELQSEASQSCTRLREGNVHLREKLAGMFETRDAQTGTVVRLREEFESGRARIDQQDAQLKIVRDELSALQGELSGLQLAGRELELEAEHLCGTILERHRLDLRNYTPPEGAWDSSGKPRRLEELRRQIESMGEVNLTAIEEFHELEERYTFLTTQREDLQESLTGLQSAISKINRTTRRRFRETFDLVNAKFQENFPRLFRGGSASLRLTDEEDLLDTGIEIDAQPPGKRLQNVTLLSGGEKALTAVALIFSIFMVKPSPFCLLDEVDAPLDDANIGRFNEIVREMSKTSQFVIITHSKRTMEIADTLYGVTMEEPGVSKTVSVRINEY
jgi:chromosome segregation protein